MIGYTRTLLVSSNNIDQIARVAKQSDDAKVPGLYEKYSEKHEYYDYIHDIHLQSHNTCGDCPVTGQVNDYQSRNKIYTRSKATDMNDDHEYTAMRSTTHPSFIESIKSKLHARKPPETIFEESDKDLVSDDYVNICTSCRNKKLVQDIKHSIKTFKDNFTNTLSNFRDTFTETVMHNSTPRREYTNKESVMPLHDEGFPEKKYSYSMKYPFDNAFHYGDDKEKYPFEKEVPYRDNKEKYPFEKEVPYRDNSEEYPLKGDYGYEAPNADLVRTSNAETQTRKDSECNTDMPIKDHNEVDLIRRALEKEPPIYRDVSPSKRPQKLKTTVVPLVHKGTDLPDLKEEEPDLKNTKTKYMLLLKNIDGTIEEAIEISKAARKVLYNEGISDVIVDNFVEAKPLKTIKKDAETSVKKKTKVPLAEKLYKSVKSRYNSQNYVKNDMKACVERQSPIVVRKGHNRTICVKQCMRQEFSRPPRRLICSVKDIDPRLRNRLTAST